MGFKNGVNIVQLIGNIGSMNGVELKEFGHNKCAITISVATTESYKSKGEWKEVTQWHDVIIWGQQAKFVAKQARTGREVYVQGTLKYRQYKKRVGNEEVTITKAEIDAKNIKFFDGDKSSSNHAQAQTTEKAKPVKDKKPDQTPKKSDAQKKAEKEEREKEAFPHNVEENLVDDNPKKEPPTENDDNTEETEELF